MHWCGNVVLKGDLKNGPCWSEHLQLWMQMRTTWSNIQPGQCLTQLLLFIAAFSLYFAITEWHAYAFILSSSSWTGFDHSYAVLETMKCKLVHWLLLLSSPLRNWSVDPFQLLWLCDSLIPISALFSIYMLTQPYFQLKKLVLSAQLLLRQKIIHIDKHWWL